MKDLKLCPFCGNEVDNHKDDCYFRLYSVAFVDSLVLGKAGMHVHVSARELNEAWNTRAERTCGEPRGFIPHDQDNFGHPSFTELWCEHSDIELDPEWEYCPHCGAKVVES